MLVGGLNFRKFLGFKEMFRFCCAFIAQVFKVLMTKLSGHNQGYFEVNWGVFSPVLF